MSDGGAAVVRLAAAEEYPSHLDIFIRLSSASASASSSSSSPCHSSLTVCAPAALLSRVPYFATQLAEPWIDFSSKQIALECTPGTSPHDYLQCLLLLRSSPTSWPTLLASVSEVLQILPVADHLLFQDCWDACMGVLASFPWSIDEEDAIRTTISKLNMESSSDVKERLDRSQDGTALESLFHKMLQLEASFGSLYQKCLHRSSAPFVAAFHSTLLKEIKGHEIKSVNSTWLTKRWYVLANILLQFTDAQQFILYLVNSEDLLRALTTMTSSEAQKDAHHVFEQVLDKVDKRVVLLSNLQRARLVKWSEHLHFEKGSPQYDMRRRLAETLPITDPAHMDVMKSDYGVIPKWIDRVTHRAKWMTEAAFDVL